MLSNSSMWIGIIMNTFHLGYKLECKSNVKYYSYLQVIYFDYYIYRDVINILSALNFFWVIIKRLRVMHLFVNEMIWLKKSWIWIYDTCIGNIKWCNCVNKMLKISRTCFNNFFVSASI